RTKHEALRSRYSGGGSGEARLCTPSERGAMPVPGATTSAGAQSVLDAAAERIARAAACFDGMTEAARCITEIRTPWFFGRANAAATLRVQSDAGVSSAESAVTELAAFEGMRLPVSVVDARQAATYLQGIFADARQPRNRLASTLSFLHLGGYPI